MTDENTGKVVLPCIREFTNQLALVMSTPEISEIFRHGTPEKKLEQLIIAGDILLEPQGNWGLVNIDMTIREWLGLTK